MLPTTPSNVPSKPFTRMVKFIIISRSSGPVIMPSLMHSGNKIAIAQFWSIFSHFLPKNADQCKKETY